MTLSPGQVVEYRRDGFVVVRNALPVELVDELRAIADEFAETARTMSQSNGPIELDDVASSQPTDWPEWDERILRGSPTTEARSDGGPVKIPLPIAQAMGLFETQWQLSVSHFAGEQLQKEETI